jgi:hypothetical protein
MSFDLHEGHRVGAPLSSGREGELLSSALPRAVSNCERRHRSAMLWPESVWSPDMLKTSYGTPENDFSEVSGE